MLFAAGLGAGLLFWGTAEPVTHYMAIREFAPEREATNNALFLTNFHWGLHAWAIYGVTGLVIAAVRYRIAVAPIAGRKTLRLQAPGGVSTAPQVTKPLTATRDVFFAERDGGLPGDRRFKGPFRQSALVSDGAELILSTAGFRERGGHRQGLTQRRGVR